MIKVNFGAAGVTDFNVADFFLQALIGKPEIDISSTKIRLSTDAKNYVELRGDFTEDGGKNPLSYVEELNGYKFVVDGKMNYEVTGLEIDSATLGSFAKLAKYLDKSDFKIAGNDRANVLSAGSGDDRLDGGKGNDIIIGNGGDDILVGGAGSDRFVFHAGDGHDTIMDFTANGKSLDKIDLSDYGSRLKFKDLDISRDGKHDVLIEIGKHDEILLEDVNIKHITAADFIF